ncbi:MAG: hypothetical protein NDI69_06810 [Bacteriovoracaceae bacterium]|nr:hypothetical protein [Bacteriovoracaceae bacterium]
MTEKRKFPKSHRIQVLMDVLSRWGRLDKNQIAEHVGSVLDENFESESFQRAIYRDLEDLVKNNRIQVEYFSRDGGVIEDYDPEVHRNVFCQWYIPGTESQITGSGHLKNHNGLFQAPKLLKNDFSILSGNSQADPRHRHLYFQIGSAFLCIKASFQALPFSLIVSRIHGAIEQKEMDEIKKLFGARASILKVPFPRLSSFKNGIRPGHFLIEFLDESSLTITDFHSSNGTSVYKLKISEADKIRSSGAIMNDYTLTSTWEDVDLSFVKPIKIIEKTTIELPLLLDAGDEFKILVV